MDKIEAKEIAAEATIKHLWTQTGIEGVEEIFRRVYKDDTENLGLFQRVYDRLIGRKNKRTYY